MSKFLQILNTKPLLVAIAHTPEGIQIAHNLLAETSWQPDLVELRLDCFFSLPPPNQLVDFPYPILLTLRHSSEGGKFHGSPEERLQQIQPYLPHVHALDIELALAPTSLQLLQTLKIHQIPYLLSYHNFTLTPNIQLLKQLAAEAHSLGACLFKIATVIHNYSDLIPLLEILTSPAPLPIAAMAIGSIAQPARLVLAAAGSRLNYGWLHQPLVQGQLSASDLAALLDQFSIRPRAGWNLNPNPISG